MLIQNLNINNNYRHTDDYVNRYNNQYQPQNNLNKILTESEIEQSLERLDDILGQKKNGMPVPYVPPNFSSNYAQCNTNTDSNMNTNYNVSPIPSNLDSNRINNQQQYHDQMLHNQRQ